jgi:alpha-ketoglutarate-dependent taurine dioxygenase
MPYTRLSIEPLTPTIGALVGGVRLAHDLDDQTVVREIREALLEHCVLFFRDQALSHEQHKAFGRQFGELHIHPAAPGPAGHPELITIHADATSRIANGNDGFHSDVSCDPEPPMGSILHIQQVPSGGGDTLWSSMYAAYEALSQPLRALLDGLRAVHSGEQIYRGRYRDKGVDDAGKVFPHAEHPVVRTHPETGRKALFVNSVFTSHIVGLEREESDALLRFLYAHIARPEFQCRFRWEADSLAFWDNRCTTHYAVWDYFPQTRHGYRVTIRGDRPR